MIDFLACIYAITSRMVFRFSSGLTIFNDFRWGNSLFRRRAFRIFRHEVFNKFPEGFLFLFGGRVRDQT